MSCRLQTSQFILKYTREPKVMFCDPLPSWLHGKVKATTTLYFGFQKQQTMTGTKQKA